LGEIRPYNGDGYKEVTMRVVHAAALTAAALLLASVASAQGLGDAAAREREKRKAAPAKPAKVYTEGDIGRSMAPVEATPDLPATAEQAATEGQPATEGQAPAEGAPAEGAAPAKAAEDPAKAEEEAHAKAVQAWRQGLDQARKDEAAQKDLIARVQLSVNDTSGLYSPGRAANMALLEETQKKLADTQAKIAALEDEGRRNAYR
jgi:hypothetical protein